MTFDVYTTVRVRVKARDVNDAENHVISMFETHCSEMLDSPAVLQFGIPLTANNPRSERVVKE